MTSHATHHRRWLGHRAMLAVSRTVVVAFVALSCTGGDRLVSVTPSTSPPGRAFAATGACQRTCVLFDNGGALWSAIAFADSAARVPVGGATLGVVAGDSLVLRLTAEAAVFDAISPAESIFIRMPTGTVGIPLAAAAGGLVVVRFQQTDSLPVTYELNRAQQAGVTGAILLTQETSATVFDITTPWFAQPESGALRSVAGNPACAGDLSVSRSDRLCDTDVRFIQAVPADAFQASGATFQSDPGHGQSHRIVITFSVPVQAVSVTIYDPTWPGNTIEAFDVQGVSIARFAFTGNNQPGVFSRQGTRLTGSISTVVLTPPIGEYVAYSMKVQFGQKQTITLTPTAPRTIHPYVPAINDPHVCTVSEQKDQRDYIVLVQQPAASGPTPVADATVTLTLTAVTNSGGHVHDNNRAPGSFAFPALVPTKTVVTDAAGKATFTYYPPEAGGKYVVTARSAGARDTVDTIPVRFELQQLIQSAHMTFTGETADHPDSHHVTQMMADGLATLADSVFAKYGHTLGVNDESLEDGGLFDISGEWARPHCSHRNGQGADVQSTGYPDSYYRFLTEKWAGQGAGHTSVPESTHPHLKTTR